MEKISSKVGHVVAEVLAFQAFVGGVFGGREAEGGFGNLGGEDGVFELFLDAAFLPLVGQLVADGDAAHPRFDPGGGVALGAVEGAGALGGEFGVLDFLHAFVAHLGEPAFERLGLGAGDGLDQAEMPSVCQQRVFAVRRPWGTSSARGGAICPPPLSASAKAGRGGACP
jgi:hypothetical protein